MKYSLVPFFATLAVLVSGCVTPYHDPRPPEVQRAERKIALAGLIGTYEVIDSRTNPRKVDKVQFFMNEGEPVLKLFRNNGQEVFLDTGPASCLGRTGDATDPQRLTLVCHYRFPTNPYLSFTFENVTKGRVATQPGLLGMLDGPMKMTSGYFMEVSGVSSNTVQLALRKIDAP